MNPTPPPLLLDKNPDDEHLRLLEVFHYVVAGLSLLGLGFLGLHYAILNTVFGDPEMWKDAKGGPPPAEFFGLFKWFYLVFGVGIVLSGLANLASGLWIKRRRHRTFSLIVAGFNCAQFPFGTALGVFTFLVLLRDSVRARYLAAPAAEPKGGD